MTPCCPCDPLIHPGKPVIPAGLTDLPRQLATFADFRQAMLRQIPTQAALAPWRAREGEDLGVMLLELWAYVLDVLSFYDRQIAHESYLRTAVRRASLYQLVRMIGYQPRPALASAVVLGAIATGNQSITLPPRTGFRSDAFGNEPPQIFETEQEQLIHPLTNEWQVAPTRDRTFPGELLLEQATVRLSPDQRVLLRWGSQYHGGRVQTVEAIAALDGNTYLQVSITPPPTIGTNVQLSNLQLLTPTVSALLNLSRVPPPSRTASGAGSVGLNPSSPVAQAQIVLQAGVFAQEIAGQMLALANPALSGVAFAPSFFHSTTRLVLDAVYPQIASGDLILIERDRQLQVRMVDSVDLFAAPVSEPVLELTDPPTIPVTRIHLSQPLPANWIATPSRLTVHFQMVSAGLLTRVAQLHLDKGDFEPNGLALDGLIEPLPEGVASPGSLLLQDAMDQGRSVSGAIAITPQGQGQITLDQNTDPFQPKLRTPVTIFGNVIQASRGESVIDEVLGSGDATQSFQSFTLQKSPLTYFNDPAAPNGRRSTLSVRVNGVLWRDVPSFFGCGPQDEVYIVRQSEQQDTTLTFGDGKTGARLPTGIDNVIATYRHGAGAAKPPAGAIAQLAKPVVGLRRVVNPVAAGGGADGDRPQDIRRNAPTSALILGRAVSTLDFEALAREFGGVINAQATWAWDETTQRAVVKVWFIGDGGDIAADLRSFLQGQADPTTPLVVTEAIAQPSSLVLDVTLDPRFTPALVAEAIRQALVDEETGLLALANLAIGRPLFRSQIFATVLGVEGTCGVRAITVDGNPAPFAMTSPDGTYRDFLAHVDISTTSATNLQEVK